jgi:hypothetical protein
MHTEVNRGLLRQPPKEFSPRTYHAARGDRGSGVLTGDGYLVSRADDQIDYYREKARSLERVLSRLQWLILVIGGVGTLLAALHVDVWIALTTAMIAAITTYLEYEQVENTLMNYNKASSALIAAKGWWFALSPEARRSQDHLDQLVDQCERVLQREQGGWVQEMTDALAEFRLGPDPEVQPTGQKRPNG